MTKTLPSTDSHRGEQPSDASEREKPTSVTEAKGSEATQATEAPEAPEATDVQPAKVEPLIDVEAAQASLLASPLNIAEVLRGLPNLPGCYRYFDKDGLCLYVGKARDLKKACEFVLSEKRFVPAHSHYGESNRAR